MKIKCYAYLLYDELGKLADWKFVNDYSDSIQLHATDSLGVTRYFEDEAWYSYGWANRHSFTVDMQNMELEVPDFINKKENSNG